MGQLGTMGDALAIYTSQAEISSFFIDKAGYIFVSSYSAVGDGVTDDTISVQAAIDAAITAGKTEVHFVGGKTYLVNTLTNTSGITFIGDNVTISGTAGITVVSFSSHLADSALREDKTIANIRDRLQDLIDRGSTLGRPIELVPDYEYIIASLNPDDVYNLITIKPGLKVIGNNASIKIADGLNSTAPPSGLNYAFNNLFGTKETATDNNEFIEFKNVNFDLNGANNLIIGAGDAKNNCAIFVDKFDKVKIEGCTFENCPGNQVVWLINPNSTTSTVTYRNNKVKNVADAIASNYNADHSSVFIVSEYAYIEDNEFENATIPTNAAAIEVHCKYSYVENNTFTNYTHGVYPAAESADHLTNTNIELSYVCNNTFVNNRAPLVLFTVANDGGTPTSIGTVKFNNNKMYCTGGTVFVNADSELLGDSVNRLEVIDNEFIVDGTGGNIISASTKVTTLIVKGNEFIDSNDLVLYSAALNNVIENNKATDCAQSVSQAAVFWVYGASEVLKINNNTVQQASALATYAFNIACTITDGEVLDNYITGFTANQIRFTGDGATATNNCIVRHKTFGAYSTGLYGSPGSEFINLSTGDRSVILGTTFNGTWVSDLRLQSPVFDTTNLPDSFKVGVSISLVNGDAALPSTTKQGILKVEKLSESASFRKFIVQWFYPAYNDATTLADMYFRKANSATNNWSAWLKLTGV